MQQTGRVILLSGGIESGKTTLCLSLSERLTEVPLVVNGVVSPAVFENGIKTGIDLRVLSSGKTLRLAQLNPGSNIGLSTHRWLFDESVITWGNEELAKSTPCDVLIVDELGPLEFERGEGLVNGFTAIESKEYKTALVVIRPSLLPEAIRRWPDATVFSVTPATREEVTRQVLDLLLA